MQNKEVNAMIKLQISNLRLGKNLTDLNYQKQKQIQGGFNEEFYNWLVQNKDDISLNYGVVSTGEYEINIVLNRGKNNQVIRS